jgi:hypothetical protein
MAMEIERLDWFYTRLMKAREASAKAIKGGT